MTALDDSIAQLRGLATFGERVTARAAPKVEAVAKAHVSQGIDPDGNAWQPKKDGSAPLANAAKAIRAEAKGERIDLIVQGPEGWHQVAKEGGARPVRRLIPSAGDPLPDYLQAAVEEAVDEELGR